MIALPSMVRRIQADRMAKQRRWAEAYDLYRAAASTYTERVLGAACWQDAAGMAGRLGRYSEQAECSRRSLSLLQATVRNTPPRTAPRWRTYTPWPWRPPPGRALGRRRAPGCQGLTVRGTGGGKLGPADATPATRTARSRPAGPARGRTLGTDRRRVVRSQRPHQCGSRPRGRPRLAAAGPVRALRDARPRRRGRPAHPGRAVPRPVAPQRIRPARNTQRAWTARTCGPTTSSRSTSRAGHWWCSAPARPAGGRPSPEGNLGLARAFLAAGVNPVVVVLWPVDDTATADLMTAFHRHLGTGANTGEALSRAMREARQHHPRVEDWAGFSLLGSADSRLAPAARG